MHDATELMRQAHSDIRTSLFLLRVSGPADDRRSTSSVATAAYEAATRFAGLVENFASSVRRHARFVG